MHRTQTHRNTYLFIYNNSVLVHLPLAFDFIVFPIYNIYDISIVGIVTTAD